MRKALSGLGWVALSVVCGCGNDDPGGGSTVGQPMAGTGGSGGSGGLSLGIGGGGTGGGGTGGAGGSGGVSGGAGGSTSAAGSSPGGSGAGGSKPVGMCKRVAGSDADCTDLFEMPLQAYACDDIAAYSTLNGMHGGQCASASFVPGAARGACCPP